MTSRQGTSTLSNSQLALLDGRSIYLDFFGLILWDFVPTNPEEIKQIEVVRGPASAVWGANALTGVVNIITKTPREAAGTTVTLTGGGFTRDAGSTTGEDTGSAVGRRDHPCRRAQRHLVLPAHRRLLQVRRLSAPDGLRPGLDHGNDLHPGGPSAGPVVPDRLRRLSAGPRRGAARRPGLSRTGAPASPSSTGAWTRSCTTAAASPTAAAMRARRASSTPASAPSTCRAGPTWPTAASPTRRAG